MGTARGNTHGSWRPRAFQGGVYTVNVHGVLLHQYGCHGFEGYTEIDVLSVADSTLYTARMIGAGLDTSVVVVEHVILL